MILVRTLVAPSSIEGLGLFAADPIAAGTVVVRFDETCDLTFTDEEYRAMPPIFRGFVDRYGWRDGATWRLNVDDARFTNHATSPNLAVRHLPVGFESIAARDIAAGEELTEDYREFDPDFDQYGRGWT